MDLCLWCTYSNLSMVNGLHLYSAFPTWSAVQFFLRFSHSCTHSYSDGIWMQGDSRLVGRSQGELSCSGNLDTRGSGDRPRNLPVTGPPALIPEPHVAHCSICDVTSLISSSTPSQCKGMHYVMKIDNVTPFKINKHIDQGLIAAWNCIRPFPVKSNQLRLRYTHVRESF